MELVINVLEETRVVLLDTWLDKRLSKERARAAVDRINVALETARMQQQELEALKKRLAAGGWA